MTDSLDRQALNAAENVYRECDKCKVFLRSTEQESGAHLLLFRKGELQVPKGQLGMLKSLRCRLQSAKTLITHAKAGLISRYKGAEVNSVEKRRDLVPASSNLQKHTIHLPWFL